MAAALLVLAFAGVIAVSVLGGIVLGNVVVSLLALRILRRQRVALRVPPGHEVAAADVPGGALALLFEYDLAPLGFASLGYLTGDPVLALWGFQQCWVDAQGHTCAAVTVRKLAPRSRPDRELVVLSRTTIGGAQVLVATTNHVGHAQADDDHTALATLPGAGPDAVVDLHRRRLEQLRAVPYGSVNDLEQINALVRGLVDDGLRHELDLGHLQQVSDGLARLSWRRCVRAAAAAGPMARRVRARRYRRLLPRT